MEWYVRTYVRTVRYQWTSGQAIFSKKLLLSYCSVHLRLDFDLIDNFLIKNPEQHSNKIILLFVLKQQEYASVECCERPKAVKGFCATIKVLLFLFLKNPPTHSPWSCSCQTKLIDSCCSSSSF